jgi:O-acetyl-ADP-ribose deacetylase (regulator of RNase III)
VIRVVVDDLAFVTADAVVRPATSRLEPTTAALRHLEQVGGPAFWGQLKVREDLAVGAAVVTGGGDLASQLVIHAIIMSPSEPVSSTGVRRAVTSALQRAADWELATLACPIVGMGAGGLEPDTAASILCDVLQTHLGTTPFPREVCIVVERPEEQLMVEARLKRLGGPSS